MTKLKKPKGTEHTYEELGQSKRYKAETKAARSVVGKKRVEREKKSQELLKKLKPRKYLITAMSKKK